jgi:hypothetical protein
MTADIAGTLAVALVLNEPEQLIGYLKQQAMRQMEAVAPLDAHVAKKWAIVAEGMADIELKMGDVKRPREVA